MSDQTSPAAFVVIAELAVAPEHREAFLALCRLDADGSVNDEPGCRQFDVLEHDEEPDIVVLFEVYDDSKAFEAHQQTPHYAKFAEGVERFGVERRRVRFLGRAHRGGN
ncbi:MAG: antibiotic biosynthesis monooxygenase [Gluconacetobacter diazotrophicus]|nr:antibiotic biosynthesis monooxygenase [Gluconacetobacter diazotrophicus]